MSDLDLDKGPAATTRLGLCLSGLLRAGGRGGPVGAARCRQVGAGARRVISALCPHEADIPSPTFTLVQTYEPEEGPPVMHFDLYRLEAPEEALDLGIEDAFVDAFCLVEWPERLGRGCRAMRSASCWNDPSAPGDGGAAVRRGTLAAQAGRPAAWMG